MIPHSVDISIERCESLISPEFMAERICLRQNFTNKVSYFNLDLD